MKILFRFMFILLLLLIPQNGHAQTFGKNKVNYSEFKWQYIPTKNFDVYYTEGGYEIANIAAEIAEQSYEILSSHWNYTPQKRIPLLVYNSHNDFSETNVITEIIEEGTGGFTELFKNRVVLPWEGSLDKFKHVIHHELTHALMFDMLYGGLLDSIMGREYLFQVPLWFAEGLAEHESQYWSIEGDMIVRDGIINGYLPDIQYIYSGYLVYKGGESFFKFLQEEHGSSDRWIAGEMLQSLRSTKSVEKTFKAIFGKTPDELSKVWHRRLRAEHWPNVKDREIPEDFATKLTDHMELQNYINMNPTFNPTGDKIAFLTDRNDYKEILVMSAIDGRILDAGIKGEKVGDYEEMHWLRGGLTWSPDGNMLAFSTKSGKSDAIHIKKIGETGFNKIIIPEMDAVYSPAWSPDGTKILFCGIKDGKLDLFTVNIQSEEYVRITNDYFDEFDPKWSPDGTKITFASDRVEAPYKYTLNEMNGSYNIYIMNADGSGAEKITTSLFNDRGPDWSPDSENIVFTSDRNGIDNLYYVNIADRKVQPLTNLLTGASSPDWSPDGTKIAFSSFEEGGWDIHMLKRPLKRTLNMDEITSTPYRNETLDNISRSGADSSVVILEDNGLGQNIAIDMISAKPYKTKFSPDLFNADASYNTFMGIGGMGQISLSDVMGNHRINLAGNLYYSLEESNIVTQYYYLKKQTNYGIGLFHYKTYYRSSNWDMFSDRTYGASVFASRPLNKFQRLDLTMNILGIDRNVYTSSYYLYYDRPQYYYYESEKLEGVRSLNIESEFVNDNTLWSNTGPARGTRYKFNIEHSPEVSYSDVSYTTFEADYRKYFRYQNRYNFITRFGFGSSFGKDPRLFFLGGTDNWMNARISEIPTYIESSQDLFFARFPAPLRGYNYYQLYGHKYFITNFEFRFPFIQYLQLGWPIPITIGNISGTIFSDIGSAWEKYTENVTVVDGEEKYTKVFDESFSAFGRNDNDSLYLDDIKMSWGVGMRVNLGFAILRLDTAWRIMEKVRDPKPVFYLSIGPDF
ncbi:BamA/TamA family outer membrane protein [Candidatus Latescibacterota bacterium]